jgi:hypothetical protein
LELTFAVGVDIEGQVGRTIRLFDWTGVSPTRSFNLDSEYSWDLSRLYTTGEVTFLSATVLPGDYNHDGSVNAPDYVVWRKGLGTTFTQTDYDVWRAHFGQTTLSGSSSATRSAAVPEPSAYVLVLITLTGFRNCLCARRYNRGCT